MEIKVLDVNFEVVAIIDRFVSLIWIERFCGYGEFELELLFDIPFYQYEETYLKIDESDRMMIVEKIESRYDKDRHYSTVIKGRSLESILDRRVVWNHTVLTGSLQMGIATLLDENVINPSVVDRAISNFVFVGTLDPVITDLIVDAQYHGIQLYQAITDLCLAKNIGYKITLNNNNEFEFRLFAGTDRSYDQNTVPVIMLSPESGTLINSDHRLTTENWKTVALIGGEGEGSARITTSSAANLEHGLVRNSELLRREIFVDASDVSKTTSAGTLSDPVYIEQLRQKGNEVLAENIFEKTFESQIDPTQLYAYNEDYSIGDILQISDGKGHTGKTRVIEFIYSQDLSGIKAYPSFSTFE